ncbi:hypothetical protein MHH28_07645 [Paenibacillus sp. FSL K6-1217]|uniref:hypothetical protein n=1 Tax=Paenibacillus sp. FSL K6-1217 TaxID=2921466 RepID=UPI003250CDAB
MPTPQIPKVSSDATLDELRDGIIGTHRYLTYLLSTLDTLNINRLDAKVVIAESITAGKLAADSVETKNLQAGAITTEKINAGAVTADKITVGQLSAITADLGHITAGLIESIEIYGSYIATRRNAFPRAEINNTGDLLAVYTDANNYLTVEPGITNEPTITFRNGGDVIMILGPAFGFTGLLANTTLVVGSQSGLTNIICGSSGYVAVPSWSKVLNSETAVTLQDELDAIWAAIAGKANISHSHSVTIPNHNHGNPDNLNSGGGTFTVS